MKKKEWGLTLLLLSVAFSFVNLTPTAAAIGSPKMPFPWLPLILFATGCTLLIGRKKGLEATVSFDETPGLARSSAGVLNRFREQHDKALVVDTSYLVPLSGRQVGTLIDQLGTKYQHVVVPNKVLDELNRGYGHDVGRVNALMSGEREIQEESPEMAKYQAEARTYLEKSGKTALGKKVIPIILGERHPRPGENVGEMMDEVRKVAQSMKKRHLQLNRETLAAEVEKHYTVSDADVDVLASAMAAADNLPETDIILASDDRDFQYALKEMKKDGHHLAERIFYSGHH